MLPRPTVRYDPAEPRDLPAVWEVVLACTDPGQRDGWRRPDPEAPDLPPRLYPHLLLTSEGSFWVARAGERIVGFAVAIPRGRLWFLSELWVAPAYRGNGIGERLYRMTRRSVRGVKGRTRAALAGDDGGGIVLGLRDGLLARGPIFRVEGSQEAAGRLWTSLRSPERTRIARYDPAAPVGRGSPLLRLDRPVWGAGRSQDHPFRLSDPERACFLVWRAGRPAGYFYTHAGGEIGPVCATGREALLACVRHASREARASERVVLRVPSANRLVLEALVDAGFRLTGGGLLLSSAEIEGLELYLPGDDSLF